MIKIEKEGWGMTFYTVREAAAQLKVHPKTLEFYCRQGQIRAVKLGRMWRIPEDVLRKFALHVPRRLPTNGRIQDWPALAAVKLAEVWNHPEELEYPL